MTRKRSKGAHTVQAHDYGGMLEVLKIVQITDSECQPRCQISNICVAAFATTFKYEFIFVTLSCMVQVIYLVSKKSLFTKCAS